MSEATAHPFRAAVSASSGPRSHLVPLRKRGRRWTDFLLVALFIGYLALGKGFAYFGVPPVFIGEVSLLALVLAALRSDIALPSGPSPLAAAVLLAGSGLHVVVDLLFGGADAIETFRGFAFVYYALFAVLVHGALAARESVASFDDVLDRLGSTLGRSMYVAVPVLAVVSLRIAGLPLPTPTWPGSHMPVLFTKPPDIGTALAFCLPFVWHGLSRARRERVVLLGPHLVALMWAVAAALAAARSRGAILALAAGIIITFGVRGITILRVAGGLSLLWLALRITGLRVEVGARELSARGLSDAVIGIVRPESVSDQSFVATTEWRTRWWSAILRDAWSHGDWFRGPGWGTNLATKYDISTRFASADRFVALRLPHNFVVGLIGRVGFALTALFLAVPLLALRRTLPDWLRTPRSTHPVHRAVLAGLIAQIAVGLTDVYLESPQGAIVFWMQIGVAWWIGTPRPQPRSAMAAS